MLAVAEYSDRNLRKCCEDGMKENLMGYSCEKRATYILDGTACTEAFLNCCLYIKGIRDEERDLHYELARSKCWEQWGDGRGGWMDGQSLRNAWGVLSEEGATVGWSVLSDAQAKVG